MTRTGDINFITEDQVAAHKNDLVARQSPWPHLSAAIVLLALSFAVPSMLTFADFNPFTLSNQDSAIGSSFELALGVIAGLVVLGVSLTCLLAGGLFLSSAVAAFKTTNWTLRAGSSGLYIKLRSYTDYRLPVDDPVILHVPRRSVRRLQLHEEKARYVGPAREHAPADDDAMADQRYLEIEIDIVTDDLHRVDEQLRHERARYGPTMIKGVTARAKGAAVSVRGSGVLRLDWKTKRTRLTPDLDTALACLSRDYVVSSDRRGAQSPIRSLDRNAQEDRLLEMVDQGHTIDAIMLAREIYGFDLTEAKAFLDKLQRA